MPVAGDRSAVVTLPTDTQIRIVRDFDAPARNVFRAFTEPDLVRRWWHAGRGEMTVTDIDLRPGGRWRWAMVTPDGTEVAFHGEYEDIAPPERLVYTEIFEMPGVGDSPPTLNTLTFEESGGRTRLVSITETGTREVRDMIIASGMEGGMQDAYDLLEAAARDLR
jgi:uncharacterized protein YndB with AHSA1/START domain